MSKEARRGYGQRALRLERAIGGRGSSQGPGERGGAPPARGERHEVHLIPLAVLEPSLYLNFGSPVRVRLGGVEDGVRSMSMIHSHPALEACAHAKSMIDAVTGHQPSPLDGEYSSETLAT